MAKATNKTQKTTGSVEEFLNSIKDKDQRTDSLALLKIMESATGDKPKMWGTAIIGFCDIHLTYESGRELDWFKVGFSPRKTNFSIYGVKNSDKNVELLSKLGKYKEGKGCLYINKLSDVDPSVLKKMIQKAIAIK
ncbi:MAG: DUF1801 domain-containing protein [bacterium]